MMRFAWLAVMSAAVLSACGGGVESPNFDDQVAGILITPDPVQVDVGGTTQMVVQGLYSLPPGSTSAYACGTGFCSLGPAPSSVTWTVDGGNASQNASVDSASGLVRGLRHGTATVAAQFRTFTDSATLAVGGEVLTAVVVASTENGGSTSTALGRSIAYSATGTYTTYSNCTSDTACTTTTRTAPVSVAWALANPTLGTPSPAQGSDTIVQSTQQGSTTVRATVTNAEGEAIIASQSFSVTQPVLEEIRISPDNQSAAVGTTKNFSASGRFSNSTEFGEIPVSSVDVFWSTSHTDCSQSTSTNASVNTGPATSTVASADSTGSSALNSSATVTIFACAKTKSGNAITNQNGDPIIDTALFVVTQADLLEVLRACPVSLTDGTAVNCPTGTDAFDLAASLSSTSPDSTREVRLLGRFSNSDSPQVINDSFIDWTFPTGTTVATVSTQGVVSAGTVVGSAALTGAIKAGVYPNATTRSDSIQVNVTDRVCVLPFLAANGATASGDSDVASPSNVIDSEANNFATVTLAAGPVSSTVTLTITAGDVVEFDANGQAGFIIEHANNSQIDPAADMVIASYQNGSRIAPSSAVAVKSLGGATGTDRRRQLIYVNVPTAPTKFDRLDLEVEVPGYFDFTDPTTILTGLFQLLLGGNSTEFNVYSACAKVNVE